MPSGTDELQSSCCWLQLAAAACWCGADRWCSHQLLSPLLQQVVAASRHGARLLKVLLLLAALGELVAAAGQAGGKGVSWLLPACQQASRHMPPAHAVAHATQLLPVLPTAPPAHL